MPFGAPRRKPSYDDMIRATRHASPPSADWLAEPMMVMRAPVEQVLKRALRRLARRRPNPFERLAEHDQSTFLIVPANWPVAFALTARVDGDVRVVRTRSPGKFTARIEGRIEDLLDLFDGTLDADSAFFSRTIQVEGDTGAVLALHNALEAAELSVADLVGAPVGGALINHASRTARRAARRMRSEAA